jgi:hypothetical protein
MNKQFSNTLVGVLFILFGVVLILNKMDIIYFTWTEIYPIGLLFISVFSFINVSRGNKNASFWGTVCGILGVVFFMRNYGYINYFLYFDVWPIILLAFGLGFLVLFMFNPADWGVLIPGILLSFFGTLYLLESSEIDVDLFDIVFDFWPIILVLIGLGLILKALSNRKTD